LITDLKDQIQNLTNAVGERMISEIKTDMVKIKEKLAIQESLYLELNANIKKIKEELHTIDNKLPYSNILKKEDCELLKVWIGSNFDLELLYSSYYNGDKAATSHSKLDGISPTTHSIKLWE
jgi:hypothetical protein